jgi:putative hydrolase of the HAD superfamily
MPKLRGVLMDLDGTLSNLEDYIYLYASKDQKTEDLIEYRLYQYLKPVLKVISWEEFIELYLRAIKEVRAELAGTASAHSRYLYIQKTLELCGINFVPDIIQRGVEFYYDDLLRRATLYPGVLEALKAFKHNQLKTCIVTDSPAEIQIKKIRKLGIMKYVDYLVTSEEAGADKPHVEPGVLALKKLHLQQDEVIMIGNSAKTDIELAYRLGIKSVLFDPRGLYEQGKNKETYYTRNFLDIPGWLGIKMQKFSRKKLLVLDFVGTLTTEKHLIDHILATFVHKDTALISAEYQLFRQGQLSEPEFWYKLGVGDIAKAHRAIAAAVTIRRSVVSLLTRLKKQYALVLLSDFPGQWGRMIVRERGLDKLFTHIVFGNESPFTKPDPRLYGYVLQKFPDVNPENVTIVDDTPEALSTGRELLMQTVLVQGDRSSQSVFVPDSVVEDVTHIENVLEKHDKINS